MNYVIGKLKQLRNKIRTLSYFWNDYNEYLKISKNISQKDSLTANIMLAIHSLEKGLCVSKNQRVFGRDKADAVCSLLQDYIDNFGEDELVKVGINVLSEYLQSDFSTHDIDIRNKIERLLAQHNSLIEPSYAGVKIVQKPNQFDVAEIERFFRSRSSVRDFDSTPISDDDILGALKIASYTPSACNRQTSRLYVVRDKNLIQQLLDVQMGDQGWCNNASTMFIVTTNRGFFNALERHQGYIDGGLYAMNFVMGLHARQIASCFKMFVKEPKLEKQFKEIAVIPQCESPVVLILAGYYKQQPLKSPKSVRMKQQWINVGKI